MGGPHTHLFGAGALLWPSVSLITSATLHGEAIRSGVPPPQPPSTSSSFAVAQNVPKSVQSSQP